MFYRVKHAFLLGKVARSEQAETSAPKTTDLTGKGIAPTPRMNVQRRVRAIRKERELGRGGEK